MLSSTDRCPVCIADPIDDADISWTRCDICKQWYHNDCLALGSTLLSQISSYHCKLCEKQHGPSHLKRQLKRARVKIDYVALNQGETFAVDKSVHPHVERFLEFEPEVQRTEKVQPYVDFLQSSELTKDFVLQSGLPRPVLVPNVDASAGMELPCDRSDITVKYIAEKTGADGPVEVMDVLSQQSESPGWTLAQWNRYFYTAPADRDRIRNVISLEVSDVQGLGLSFVRPQMVRDLDLADKVWCDSDGSAQKRPKVTTYCLMSVAGSYTDFHIDFSGTPVYYTVCLGQKTFLMYPPSENNLALYQSWCLEPQQNFTWFGEYTKRIKGKRVKPSDGFKVHLRKGDLFIIPSGWIHSVHTPQDSVIIGGNYLTLADLPMHLTIYELEKATRVPSRYRFPMFNKVLWLASWYFYNHQEEFLRDTGVSIVKAEGTGEPARKARAILTKLIAHLAEHYESSKTKPIAKKSIPTQLIGKNIPEYLGRLETWRDSLP